MLKINLAPEIQKERSRVAKINHYTMIICVFIAITISMTIIVLFGINLTTKRMVKTEETEISALEKEIKKYKDVEETVLELEKGLAEAKKILDGPYNWKKIFPHIEAATPKDIRFKNITLSENKITGTISGLNINSIARFIESYKTYQTVMITGKSFKDVKKLYMITKDGLSPLTIDVKSDGSWEQAVTFDPTQIQTFKISLNKADLSNIEFGCNNQASNDKETPTKSTNTQPNNVSLCYNPIKKEMTSTSNNVSTNIKKLFTDVEVKSVSAGQSEYVVGINQRVSAYTAFVTIKFEGKVIW